MKKSIYKVHNIKYKNLNIQESILDESLLKEIELIIENKNLSKKELEQFIKQVLKDSVHSKISAFKAKKIK